MKALQELKKLLGLLPAQVLPPPPPVMKLVKYSAEVHLRSIMHIVKGDLVIPNDCDSKEWVVLHLLNSGPLVRVGGNTFIRKAQIQQIVIKEISEEVLDVR